jgi:DNA-binding NarL/FixJ family response regulator
MAASHPYTATTPHTGDLRVLIVDDSEYTREGLGLSIGRKSAFQIVGAASNGREALALAEQQAPQVVLMDIDMPVLDGIAATRQMKQEFPHIKIMMLTSRRYDHEIYTSLAAGASAYCLKDISAEKLVQVIQLVFDGAIYIDPAVTPVMSALFRNEKVYASDPMPRRNTTLTERELDVLKLVAQGKSNKEISLLLQISINTVKLHLGKLISKLDVEDRTQAAIKALQLGVIAAPAP